MKEEIIRNQTRFPIPPGHLVHAIRHPIPDNDITFRGFSVGISPIIYPAQSGVALSRCNIRSWRGSTRPSMKRSRASVVTFALYFIPSLPSSELSTLLERGNFYRIRRGRLRSSSSNWIRSRQYRDAPWKIIGDGSSEARDFILGRTIVEINFQTRFVL